MNSKGVSAVTANLKKFATAFERMTEMRKRVASAAVLAPLVALLVYYGGTAYDAAVSVATILCAREWICIAAAKAKTWLKVSLYAAVAGSLLLSMLDMSSNGLDVAVLAPLLLYVAARLAKEKTPLFAVLGVPYLAFGGMAMIELRRIEDAGVFMTAFLFIAVWATDIFAYFAGRAIGGPKICPSISPKKTWAGLAGGMVAASLFGYIAFYLFGAENPWAAGALAAGLAVVSQIGDFFESYVKRRFGVKDSGCVIPGHGGLLDRIDGLIFASVFLFILTGVWI